jgi:hypothetical protein
MESFITSKRAGAAVKVDQEAPEREATCGVFAFAIDARRCLLPVSRPSRSAQMVTSFFIAPRAQSQGPLPVLPFPAQFLRFRLYIWLMPIAIRRKQVKGG